MPCLDKFLLPSQTCQQANCIKQVEKDRQWYFWINFNLIYIKILHNRYREKSCNGWTFWTTRSVTKFGKIFSFEQFSEDLFPIWENFAPTLANFVCHWASFHWCKWPRLKNYLAIRSHWGTPPSLFSWTFQYGRLLSNEHSTQEMSMFTTLRSSQ